MRVLGYTVAHINRGLQVLYIKWPLSINQLIAINPVRNRNCLFGIRTRVHPRCATDVATSTLSKKLGHLVQVDQRGYIAHLNYCREERFRAFLLSTVRFWMVFRAIRWLGCGGETSGPNCLNYILYMLLPNCYRQKPFAIHCQKSLKSSAVFKVLEVFLAIAHWR